MRRRGTSPSLPRQRAVDGVSACKRHRFRQLAFCRQIAGDALVVGCKSAKFFAHIHMWIVSYSGRKIFDSDYLMLVRSWKKRSGKSFKIEPLIGSILQQPMIEIESIDIENRLLHLCYCGFQRQGPGSLPAPHRIAVAQRVVSNPSRGSVVLYQIFGANVRGCSKNFRWP